MKNIYLMCLVLMISSCSLEDPGLKELIRLCEKDAGLKIYKAVEADGYYDTTGGFDLVQSPYKFYEYCNNTPFKFSVIPEPGCYRVEKVKRETGLCHQGYDDALWKNSFARGYSEFRENNCIAVEKIEKSTARYKYEVDIKHWWLNERVGTEITSYTNKIIDNEVGEVIGTAKNYVLRPKKHSDPPTISCGSYQVTGLKKSMPFAKGLVEKTLLSRKNQQTGELK